MDKHKQTQTSPLLTRKQAADYIGVKVSTLATWASTGRYNLRLIKVGRLAKYFKADLDNFLQSRAKNGGT